MLYLDVCRTKRCDTVDLRARNTRWFKSKHRLEIAIQFCYSRRHGERWIIGVGPSTEWNGRNVAQVRLIIASDKGSKDARNQANSTGRSSTESR